MGVSVSVYLGHTMDAPIGVSLESTVGIAISVVLKYAVWSMVLPHISPGYTVDITIFF